jgi:predicted kinase
VAVGKSTLAAHLAAERGALIVYTPDVLRAALHPGVNRDDLAAAGDSLARRTHGDYLIDAAEAMAEQADADLVAIDAFRRLAERDAARHRLHGALLHVHLTAADFALEDRYVRRSIEQTGNHPRIPYQALTRHPGESQVERVGAAADLRLDTTDMTAIAVADVVWRSVSTRWPEDP